MVPKTLHNKSGSSYLGLYEYYSYRPKMINLDLINIISIVIKKATLSDQYDE